MGKIKKEEVCSFCGRPMPEMYSGMDGSLICTECIEEGHRMVSIRPQSSDADDHSLCVDNLPTPQEIKDFLDL